MEPKTIVVPKTMANPQLTFRIVGSDLDDGAVSFDDFVVFCANVTKCLKSVEHVAVGATNHVRFRIADLKYGSASLTLVPVPTSKGRRSDCQSVTTLFRKTIAALGKGQAVDKRFRTDDLKRFRELALPLERHAKEVWVGRTKISGKFTENIDKLLDDGIPSRGEVAGRLERLDVHGRHQFELFPPLGGKVTCEFEPKLLAKVLKAVTRQVNVVGTLKFVNQEPFPQRVQVSAMELRPHDEELPTLASLRGLAPDCTDGMESVTFVRAIRDEQD